MRQDTELVLYAYADASIAIDRGAVNPWWQKSSIVMGTLSILNDEPKLLQ